MKQSIIILFALNAIYTLFSCSFLFAKDISLTALKPTKTDCVYDVKTSTIKGVSYQQSIVPTKKKGVCYLEYNLQYRFERLVGIMGVPDNNPDGQCRFHAIQELFADTNTDIFGNNNSLISTNSMTGIVINNWDEPYELAVDSSNLSKLTVRLNWGCILASPMLRIKPNVKLSQVEQVGQNTEDNSNQNQAKEDINKTPVVNDCPIIMPDNSTDLVTQLSEAITKNIGKTKLLVFVAPLKPIGLAEDCAKTMTQYLQDDVTNAMVDMDNFVVVERERLDETLKELNLQYSGLIDEKTARKVGEILGADAALVGSVSKREDKLIIQARLVDVESGTASAAAKVIVEKEQTTLENPRSLPTTPPPTESEPSTTAKPGFVWECALDKMDGSKRHVCRGCDATESEARQKAAKVCAKTNHPKCDEWSKDSYHTTCVQKNKDQSDCGGLINSCSKE